MIKINFHSIVDVITNSSTTIYTYQNSVSEAKELVAEVLKLAGIEDKTPDDVFYYGVFCDDDVYLDDIEEFVEEHPELKDMPQIDYDAEWGSEVRKRSVIKQTEWFDSIKLAIIKGEREKPEWMSSREKREYYDPDSRLFLLPKDEKYQPLADKISKLLGSVGADGCYDG